MSDLSNFTIYKENAGMFAGIEVLQPLAGSGTLLMHANGQGSTNINLARAIAPRAFTSGVARFLIGFTTANVNDQVGFAFQQSQEDLTNGTGSAYLAMFKAGSNGVNSQIQILRIAAGLQGAQTLIGTGALFTLAPNTPLAVEIRWLLDIAGLGGIQLTAKHSTSVDFTGLITDVNVVSTATVLQTSVTEGPYLKLGASFSTGQFLFETANTDVVPLLVGA